MFEGKTPQEAAVEVMDLSILDMESAIAAACRHFYERGLANTFDPQQDVRQFMAIAKQAIPERPQWPDQATMDLRVRLIAEEFCEWLRDSGYDFSLFISAQDFYSTGNYAGDRLVFSTDYEQEIPPSGRHTPRSLPKSADALIDLLYVTIGSLLAMGIDLWPLWAEVQRCNMAKLGGPVINGKLCKPEGFKPPDIEALLLDQGWEGE